MKKYLIYLLLISVVLVSCDNLTSEKDDKHEEKEKINEKKELYSSIIDLEQELFAHLEPDVEMAHEMIGKYIHFANKYPEDTATSNFLFKAAEIAMNFGQPNNAITYLTRIEDDYEDFEKYGTSLFLKAHIYNYYLKNNTKAEEYYTLFIEKYPNHSLVEDAKAALMLLDFDDMQLIEYFEQLNT